jgi:anti-sigma B factor antagonist
MSDFKIETVPGESTRTLVLSGELDLATAAEITDRGSAALSDEDTTALVVDLETVTFMDSTAIDALVGLHNEATAAGKQLTLCHIPARVQRLLDITGLNQVFGVQS